MLFTHQMHTVLLLMLLLQFDLSQNAFGQHASRNATTIHGQPVLLNCTVLQLEQPLTIIWLRPSDGLPVSVDLTVASEHDKRLQVIGDPRVGQYHLLIHYTIHPYDAGTWTCTSLLGQHHVHQQTTLVVLVSPAAQIPEITPDYIDVSTDVNSLYTFTCVAHYAFPPVNLTWLKDYGPDVPYTISPPRVLVSRDRTYSMSITLVVTTANANSQFSCLASHPTFMGDSGRRSARFMVAGNENSPNAQAQSSEADQLTNKIMPASTSKKHMDDIDRVFLLIAIAIVASCFFVGVVLSKCNSRWQLADVHSSEVKTYQGHIKYTTVDTTNIKAKADDDKLQSMPAVRSKCTCKIMTYLTLAVLLMSSLLFAIPFYIKGITIPLTETDEMTSVFAGGALWLDCTTLTLPVESLVQVTWHRSDELLYHQYYLNGQVINYPPNTTTGILFHVRVMSAVVGQVTLYPVIPGDDGIYTCRVITISGDDVTQTSERQKTITVFVLMGPVDNYALLFCLSLALLSAACIITLTLHGMIQFRCSRQHPHKDGVNVRET